MADEENSNQAPTRQRRSSFAGQTFAGIFGTGRGREARGSFGESDTAASQPGPITAAATQARNRRMSLTTLGLSTSPETVSRFSSFRNHRDSVGSSPGSIDESAIEDDLGPREPTTPGSSFQRRASFGARAFMDVRTSAGGASNGGAGQNGTKSPRATSFTRAPNGTNSPRDAQGRGEGFNWSENFRSRAERTSIAAANTGERPNIMHERAKSVAVMEPPVAQIPKTPARPDHFQERILKGDFYMD